MTLGILVGRFGDFVGKAAPEPPEKARRETRIPTDIVPIFDRFSHHLIPLLLLAHDNGKSALAERRVVFDYCLSRAKAACMSLTLGQEAELMEYVLRFQPSRAQLVPALERLKGESKDEIVALVSAAEDVVRERHSQEARFLERLKRDIEAP